MFLPGSSTLFSNSTVLFRTGFSCADSVWILAYSSATNVTGKNPADLMDFIFDMCGLSGFFFTE